MDLRSPMHDNHEIGNAHVMMAYTSQPSNFGLLAVGLDLGKASTPIWEYPRLEPLLNDLNDFNADLEVSDKDAVRAVPRRAFV